MSTTMYKNQLLGYVVRHLREQAIDGATQAEMFAYLRPRVPQPETMTGWRHAAKYLREAFLQDNSLFYVLGPAFSFSEITPETEDFMREQIVEFRSAWEAQRYPELLRVRDYVSFLELARDEHLHLTVCDAPPGSTEYRLHGVYDADSHRTAWTARRGEKLRADLNRRLGREMVLRGPLDDEEERGEPRIPAISFGPERSIENHLRLRGLAGTGPYFHIWDRLYPQHAVRS